MVTNMKLAFTNGPWSSELQEGPKLEVEPDLNGGDLRPLFIPSLLFGIKYQLGFAYKGFSYQQKM